jgi:hypothetical protein
MPTDAPLRLLCVYAARGHRCRWRRYAGRSFTMLRRSRVAYRCFSMDHISPPNGVKQLKVSWREANLVFSLHSSVFYHATLFIISLARGTTVLRIFACAHFSVNCIARSVFPHRALCTRACNDDTPSEPRPYSVFTCDPKSARDPAWKID